MEFTKSSFAKYREDLNEALRPLGEKYGLTFEPVNHIHYEGLSFNFKVVATKAEVNGVPVDKAKEDFVKYCGRHGLQPDDYQKRCHYLGEKDTSYIIVGIKPKATVNSIIIKRESDGKEFVCPAGMLAVEGREAPKWKLTLTDPPKR